MSRYNHRRKWNRTDYIKRTIGAVITIVLLVLFMPRESVTTFHYRIGEPWDYTTLIAQDSFPILKSQNALEQERDSIRRYYEPYFQILPDVETIQKEAVHKAFDNELKGQVPRYYLSYITEKLTEIYTKGIIGTQDFTHVTNLGAETIRLYNYNESRQESFSQVFTQKSAYEYLLSPNDTTQYPVSVLLKCALNRFLVVNLQYDAEKSNQQRTDIDNMVVPYKGQVLVGQKIVDRGQIVDEDIFQVLQSLEKYQQEREKSQFEIFIGILGQIIFVTLIVLMLLFYFKQFRSDYLTQDKTIMLILTMLLSFPLITYLLVSHTTISPFVIPFCIAPIFVRIFMDSRSAFITHLTIIMLCSIATEKPMEFVVTEFVAGLVAIYALRELTQRSEMFAAIIFVLVASLFMQLGFDLIHGRLIEFDSQDMEDYLNISLSCLLLMISYLLLIPFERMFGFISNVTLIELSNFNNPLLRKLSEEAPGTFQHSMQVANLAAEVAVKIGAKSMLVRTGALYHDIGKIRHAAFFTENQKGINPHDRFTNEQSAQIIISHVREGVALAEKYKLPKAIRDLIATHHGTSMTRYFYVQAQNKSPEHEIDRTLFTYPGPNPTTAEQAILMMADAVEAASRSLTEYTEENISQLVDRIIDAQVSGGYFNQCAITFLDIQTAREVFKSKLRTVYHTRVQYPELKVKG